MKRNNYEVGEIWYDNAGNRCFNREDGTISVQTVNEEPSLTIQSEKDNCDLNVIVNKFLKTGMMTNIRKDQPRYGDFTGVSDYQSAVIAVQDAEEQFMELPATIRKRFDNDPQKLLSFVLDDSNRDEAIKLGLVEKPQATQVPQGEATPPSVTPA